MPLQSGLFSRQHKPSAEAGVSQSYSRADLHHGDSTLSLQENSALQSRGSKLIFSGAMNVTFRLTTQTVTFAW